MSTTVTQDTPSILDEARSFIERFVAFEDEAHSTLIALWCLHTHAFDAAFATPYLYITSAGPECGKTRTLETVSTLVRNARKSDQMTPAAMFRVIEASRPTLLVDEVDTVYSGGKANEELRTVLNGGYEYSGSVDRAVPSGQDLDGSGVKAFSTFCPKMLAGIDNNAIPVTVRSRMMRIELRRAKDEQRAQLERFRLRKVAPEAEELRHKMTAWGAHNLEILSAAEPKPIEELSDRQWDISEPLVAIAEVLGIGKEVREMLIHVFAGQQPTDTEGVKVLRSARDLFDESGADRIPSALLAEATDVAPGRLGRILDPYGVKSTTIVFGHDLRKKGYYRASFTDAWERYL